MYLLIWMSICILYNKLVIVRKAVFWVLWTVLKNYQTWGGDHGHLQFMAGWSEVQKARPGLVTGVWSGGRLVGLSPSPMGSVLNLGSVGTELSWRIPCWCLRRTEELVRVRKKTHIFSVRGVMSKKTVWNLLVRRWNRLITQHRWLTIKQPAIWETSDCPP